MEDDGALLAYYKSSENVLDFLATILDLLLVQMN